MVSEKAVAFQLRTHLTKTTHHSPLKNYVKSTFCNFRNGRDFDISRLSLVWLGVCQFGAQFLFSNAVYLRRISRRKMMLNTLALIVKLDELLPVLLTTIIFVAIGLIVFAGAFFIIVRVVPFSVKKEIEEDQNVALAVLIGSLIIGMSLIISAAISGN
jgi:putative membrane protein